MDVVAQDNQAVAEFDWHRPLDKEVLRGSLERDGIILLRNLLGRDDIEILRSAVRTHLVQHGRRFSLGLTQPNAASLVPALETLFADPRVVRAFRTALGAENIVFTGHSDIHMNMLSGWHKDSGEAYGGYFSGDYFAADDCHVYKMALYLQDHPKRNGLTVRLGSHRTRKLQEGPVAYMATRAGDAAIFDVRLSHIGQVPNVFEKTLMRTNVLLNGMDRSKQDWPLTGAVKSLGWRLAGCGDRLSIFFTYGADNRFTAEFASANMARQNAQAGKAGSSISPKLRDALLAQGVIPWSAHDPAPAAMAR